MGDGGDMVGLVRLFDEALASTLRQRQEDAEEASVREMLAAFDQEQEEHWHALDEEREKAARAAALELLTQQTHQNAFIHQLMADREHAMRAGEAPPVTATPPTFI